MGVPRVFAVFPLESVLLVPGALLPLHVFEPRYRAMLRDALAGTGTIGMAMPRAGHATADEREPPLHPVVGLGRIVRHVPHPDGRADILLEGVARMRIDQELPREHAYRVVHAEPLPDAPVADPGSLAEGLADLVARVPGVAEEDRARLLGLPAAASLDAVLLRLPIAARDKHRIHAEPDPELRLAALHRVLDVITGLRYTLRLRPGDPRLN